MPEWRRSVTTQCGACLGVEKDHAAVGAPHAPRDVMLEQQQVVEVVCGYEGGWADVDQPSLDQLERRMGA